MAHMHNCCRLPCARMEGRHWSVVIGQSKTTPPPQRNLGSDSADLPPASDFRLDSVQGGLGGGGCTHAMHGRSRMTIDPRIPTMPESSTSGLHSRADVLISNTVTKEPTFNDTSNTSQRNTTQHITLRHQHIASHHITSHHITSHHTASHQ